MTYTLRGTTTNYHVYYDDDPALTNGPALADYVLAKGEADMTALSVWFGGINLQAPQVPFKVYITIGDTGASHPNCYDPTITVHAWGGPPASSNEDYVCMLVAAEVAEVFMAVQNAWTCDLNTGEALSRVLSTELYPNSLGKWATAGEWLDGDRPDWVTKTDSSDQHPQSIGCAALFLNYLHYQLNYPWTKIIAAGGDTGLDQTYNGCTGNLSPNPVDEGWRKFRALVDPRYPLYSTSHVTTDNIFPILPYVQQRVTLDRIAAAWMILTGVLLLTPAHNFCIACWVPPHAPGYIGQFGTAVVGIGSLAAGIAQIVKQRRSVP